MTKDEFEALKPGDKIVDCDGTVCTVIGRHPRGGFNFETPSQPIMQRTTMSNRWRRETSDTPAPQEAPDQPKGDGQPVASESPGNPPNPHDPTPARLGFPSGAVEALRLHRRATGTDGSLSVVSDQALDEVLAWIGRYTMFVRPDMELSLGNDVGELVIEDPDLEVELIRFNGRTFVPETPTIVDDGDPHDLAFRLGEIVGRFEAGHCSESTVVAEVSSIVEELARGEVKGPALVRAGSRVEIITAENGGLCLGAIGFPAGHTLKPGETFTITPFTIEPPKDDQGDDEDHNPDGFRHASPEVAAVIADAVTVRGFGSLSPDEVRSVANGTGIGHAAAADMSGKGGQ